MKVLAARVVILVGYANDPHIELLVDSIPSRESLVYKAKRLSANEVLFFAESDGYVSFLAHDKRNQHGFSGATFEVALESGQTVRLVGPWSSRSDVMNAAGFTRSIDVSITSDPDAYERGYTFMASHITEQALLDSGIKPEFVNR